MKRAAFITFTVITLLLSSCSIHNVKDSVSSKTELSKSELSFFTEYFNKYENNGFLLSSYTKPAEIDLENLLYNGAGIKQTPLNAKENQALLHAMGVAGTHGDIIRITTSQINNLLENKAGISLSDIKTKFDWIYLKEYDAYYSQVFDCMYTKTTCLSGYKTNSGIYVIECRGEGGSYEKCTVTLKKHGDNYLFLSNKITDYPFT